VSDGRLDGRFDGRLGAVAATLMPSLAVGAVLAASLLVGPYWKFVVAMTLAAMLTGVGLAMLVGFARCITLASGAMMALGAYGTTLLVVSGGWPYLPALAAAVAIGAVAGLVLGIPCVRFRSHNLALVTLVFQATVIIVMRQWTGLTGGAQGLSVPTPRIFGIPLATDLAFMVFVAIAVMFALPVFAALLRGAFGTNLRALAANEVAARAYGISVESHLVAAFVASSAGLAFAGALSAPGMRIIDPDSFGIAVSIFALAGPIIGGIGSLWGGLIGGAVMRLLPEVLRPVADYTDLLMAALVLAVVIFMPDGIVGLFRRGLGYRQPVPPRPASAGRPNALEVGQSRANDRKAPALVVAGLSVDYGAVRAVADVSLEIPAGTIYGLMGPNGAGKTTVFNAISGFVVPTAGRVEVFGEPLLASPIHRRIVLGVSRTFQQVATFPTLSCRDNVLIGLGRNDVAAVMRRSFDGAVAGPVSRREAAQAEAALDAVGLGAYGSVRAGTLSLGNQRRLEMARAIVSRPRLILLDEPVSGVSHDEAAQLSQLLQSINRKLGITMLIVEHNIGFLTGVCDRLAAMAQGRMVLEGKPQDVVASTEVRRVYFGEPAA
jgi:branched-chain amino acid transport system permease protein